MGMDFDPDFLDVGAPGGNRRQGGAGAKGAGDASQSGAGTADTLRREARDKSRNLEEIPQPRFGAFLETLDTPAKRLGLLALCAGLALALFGLWEFAVARSLSGLGDFLNVNRRHCRHVLFGAVLAVTGIAGMTGRLDRLWDWVLHGSKRR